MTGQTAGILISDSGRELIARVEREAAKDSVRALIRLRKTEDPDLVSGAWEVVEARKLASTKFGELGASMFFTTEALEQASSAGASAHHARSMADAGVTSVLDICGGIGADALAFARAGLDVTVCEIDPARAVFAAENARVAGLAAKVKVITGDVAGIVPELGKSREGTAVWFDPARRVDGRRVNDPEEYNPPLSFIETLRGHGFKSIGAKLSPAIDHAIGRAYGGELEFLSDQGECKEALLWTGALDRGRGIVATVIGKSAEAILWESGAEPSVGSRVDAVSADVAGYLYEPDPAVIRAHLVQALGERIGAGILDPHIAYLIGPDLFDTPFATAYAVVDRFAFHIKALNRALRERSVGRVVIKKRGFPQEPEQVRKQLKLAGDQEMTIVLTRVGLQHQVILCRPVNNPR